MERNDYQVEIAEKGGFPGEIGKAKLSRREVDSISFIKGLCAADPGNPEQPREREWYLNNVIKPMIDRKEIDDGSNSPFDDRKLRYDGARLHLPTPLSDYTSLIFSLGVTHYKAFQADQERSDEENLALQKRGEELFDDRYAFFSRCPGIAVLPITKEGSVFVGERTNEEAGGFLNAVAGHLKFRNPEDVDLMKDLNRELGEFGIRPSSLIGNPIFVGVYSNPIKGDLDFTYIARTNISKEYFTSGIWKEHATEREHKPLIQLASMGDIQRLLEEGKVPDGREFPLMYSTRGALESVTEEELRAL